MNDSAQSTSALPGLWTGQSFHGVAVGILLALVTFAWIFLERVEPVAFWIAVGIPILHQVFTWICWRIELQSKSVSQRIGFATYVFIFSSLFISRFASLAALAWLDRDSLGLPKSWHLLAACALAVPATYALYSVSRYFGMVRATGADHFDADYRSRPLVDQGIFRFTNNGMYFYVFLFFWAIALVLNSASALAVAAFSHAYIWVHYFATEKPDMDYLYRQSNS